MKFLVIHNDYGVRSGEEVTVDIHCKLLADRGHSVVPFRRSSAELEGLRLGRMRAFASGVYNPIARRRIRELVRHERPDVAFVQNLYPLISPSILPVLRQEGVPVVMRVANFRLVCPNGLLLSRGEICSRCVGGREYWYILHNCEESLPKSIKYALRNAVARRRRWYLDNVSIYISATRFVRGQLISGGGLEAARIYIVSNPVPMPVDATVKYGGGKYVGYFGRISREKGIPQMLDAARKCPDIPFRLVGSVHPGYRVPDEIPPNVQLSGPLYGDALADFIQGSRVVVSPSTCYETFGMSVAEAMLRARPVVVPNHGVFPELIQDGASGLLHAPADADSLARAIRRVWDDPVFAAGLGKAARERAVNDYDPEAYYARFMAACDAVMASQALATVRRSGVPSS